MQRCQLGAALAQHHFLTNESQFMKHDPDATKPFPAVLTFKEAMWVLMTPSSMGRGYIDMNREDAHYQRQEGNMYIMHYLPNALN